MISEPVLISAYKRFAGTMEQVLPNHVPTENVNDLRWLSNIRAVAKARFEPQKDLDISDCGEKVKGIINDHLQSLGVKQWIKPITLFNSDFQSKVNTLKSEEYVQVLYSVVIFEFIKEF